MRKIILVLAVAAISTPSCWPQAQIVKQRADQIRQRNNDTQATLDAMSGQPAAPPPQSSAPTAVSAPPAAAGGGMDPAQVKLIEHLTSDLGALKPGTAATAEQKNALVNDLTAISKVPVKPSKAAMTKTVDDLAAALDEKSLSPAQLTKLARSLNVVLNCSRLDAAHAQTWIAEAQTVFKAVGVSAPTVQSLGTNLGSMVADIQHTKSKLYQ